MRGFENGVLSKTIYFDPGRSMKKTALKGFFKTAFLGRHYEKDEIKVSKTGKTCNPHGRYGKCIHNFR
jgi:hypothetical protein